MGKKRAWPRELADRCEAVGWDVKLTGSNHYWVNPGNNDMAFSFGSTPSSNRAERYALAAAKKAGLYRLEEAQAEAAERARLRRIKADRASVETFEHTEPAREERATMTKPQQPPEPGALGYVDGVAIVETAPAMYQTPIMKAPKAYPDGEELLLADGRVVYRCTKPADDGTGPCHKILASARSVINHGTWHGREPSSAQAESMRKAIAAKRRINAANAAAKHTPEPDTVPTVAGQPEPTGVVARLMTLIDELDALAGRTGALGTELDGIRADAESTRDELRDVVKQIADDNLDVTELREKAARFDELRERFFG